MFDETVELTAPPNAALAPFLRGLRLPADGLLGISGGLALAERITGARLTGRDVKAMTSYHLVAPLLAELPAPGSSAPTLEWEDDQARAYRIAAQLRDAPPALQRKVAAFAVQESVTRAGLASRPPVKAALPRLSAARPPAVRGQLELQVRQALANESALWMRTGGDDPSAADRRIQQRGRAMDALYQATNQDPELAAFNAVRTAHRSLDIIGADLAPRIEAYLQED
ncbi:hypothetical protein [Motilibacter deserti]|uniref:Uncharacterized protein n=1 Tax=Motilibacter deserti TaxID=2714956 RepID=A0ABX0GYD2_9ACTN|nr:hypothetical protein [Motilibacter deserti]NHC14582.1 hypothetical protein [Motilibacter deserti]